MQHMQQWKMALLRNCSELFQCTWSCVCWHVHYKRFDVSKIMWVEMSVDTAAGGRRVWNLGNHGDARVHESSKQQRCRPSCRPLPSSEGRRRRSSSRSQETQIANLSPVFSCYVATGALSATAIAAKHGNGSVSQPAVNNLEEWTMNG